MQTYQKIILFTGLPIILLWAGCMEPGQSFNTMLKPADTEQKPNPSAANRFQNAAPGGPTAVESAIELSKKYAALSEEMGKLKVEKQDLVTENSRLTQAVSALETELNQAKKELSEANDLLIEMRIELNNWKADVLGFRDEMRKADQAQLETLLKILNALGGEVSTEQALESASQENPTDKNGAIQ